MTEPNNSVPRKKVPKSKKKKSKNKANNSDVPGEKAPKSQKKSKNKALKKDNTNKGIGQKSKKIIAAEAENELEKKLQAEVKSFLSKTNLNKESKNNKNQSEKKKSKKQSNRIMIIDDHKKLNKTKHASKLLKKKKLRQIESKEYTKKLEQIESKEYIVNKCEKSKKKRTSLIDNNGDEVDFQVESKKSPKKNKSFTIDEILGQKNNKVKESDDHTYESYNESKTVKNNLKPEDKKEMKTLFSEFNKMKIHEHTLKTSKKAQKKENFLKTSSNNDLKSKRKRNKKLAKMLRRKEKLLNKLLDDNESESLEKKTIGLNIDKVTSQIRKLKLESSQIKTVISKNGNINTSKERETKGKKKPKHDNDENTDVNTSLENKKRKASSTKPVESEIKKMKLDQPMGSETAHSTSTSNSNVPNILATSSGGHKKEKYYNSKHTPLREKLLNKLKSARFRYLNEQLYTSKSEESKDFFTEDRESFEAYHEGFKKQVTQWPINPVDIIIKSIQERESKGRLVIADLGCGEAKLAAELTQHKVHSLDLVALNERVTSCDMTRTPLKPYSVDVAVFCLGELKIAEVESRFHDVNDFVKDIQKYGFEKKNLNMDYSLFYFLDFKKVSNLSKSKKRKLPPINLKPCLYKKR
ncbi:hypothetical protein M8J76_003443 [Diaphorina citri]|nr:hypothetical protein M8J76_003443 [Diaphorina citri]